MKFPNYITIITGHSKGLGKQLALSMQYDSYVIGISRTKAEDLICKQIEMDISDYNQFNIINENIFENSKINIVLCAGILGQSGNLLDTKLSDWENTIRTNLLGNTAVIKALLPQMIKTQYGRIVFLTGGGAAYGYPLFSGYSLSKVAIVREVENIALELKNKIDDFSIIAFAPGAMETQMLQAIRSVGAEIKTTVDINEPVEFIKNFLSMKKSKAKSLSGKFIHVRDNIKGRTGKNKWLLRRIE